MLSNSLLQAKKHASNTVMSCLEHERLIAEDFEYAEDFDYLVRQELPCFKVEVKQGNLVLAVSHYLATVILPSGISLEVLPKVTLTLKEGQRREEAIMQSRRWVAQMLTDIASDKLQQPIDEVTMRSGSLDKSHEAPSANSLTAELEKVSIPRSYVSGRVLRKVDLNTPWYLGLLNTAEQQLLTASQYLPNRYQTHVQNTPKAQGKLKLTAQLKANWHRPHYQYKEYSVFELNSELVQFLATGWQQLQILKNSQSSINPNKLTVQTPVSLQGVARLQPVQYQPVYYQLKRDANHWRSQCTPHQYRQIVQAIDWCWWLLNNLSDSSAADYENEIGVSKPIPQPALMVNMNHAFERWVLGKLAIQIKETLPDSELLIQPKFDWLISTAGSRGYSQSVIQQLIPDACVCDANGTITHVIDIKYKALNRVHEVSGSDWQQLSAYQSHLNCKNAWLIYPMTKTFKERLDVCINLDENRRPIQQDSTQMSVLPFSLIEGKLLIK